MQDGSYQQYVTRHPTSGLTFLARMRYSSSLTRQLLAEGDMASVAETRLMSGIFLPCLSSV